MNRAALYQALEPSIEATPTQQDELRKLLDKILVEATVALPFKAAQSLTSSQKAELEVIIRDAFLGKDLARLASKWEPARKLDGALKETLRDDMIDLLQNRRPKYIEYTALDLSAAQREPQKHRLYIKRTIPTADAKKLLKSWDKRLKPRTRDEAVKWLIELLEGKEAMVA